MSTVLIYPDLGLRVCPDVTKGSVCHSQLLGTPNHLRCFSRRPLKQAVLLAPGHQQGRAASCAPVPQLVSGKRGVQRQVGLVSKPRLITALSHCPSVTGTGKEMPRWPGVRHLQGSETFSNECSSSAGTELLRWLTVFAMDTE